MHTPVAAVPGVAHLVPSVAPLAHTNETKASSSPQRTVSVPVTRRKGGAGAGSPFGPGGPAEPGGPASPCGPCAPAGPGPRPLWTRHGLAASADCQHREKGKTVQKLPHRQTLQQCATACIHQLSTVKKPKVCDVRFGSKADIGQRAARFGQMSSAPLCRCYWCLQRARAKAPQKNMAPNTAANQAGGPLSGGLLKMLIAPTQSATPMPRQIIRRIYFHTIIAASKALFTCPRK